MPDVHPGLIPAIMQGAASFELETNAGIQQYKHLNVPEDAGETEIMATLQAANDALNAKHAAKVKREFEVAERARLERTARSDAWAYIVSGAGSAEVNGEYHRDGDARKNGARSYRSASGHTLSREVACGSEGWILGRAPRASYAYQTKETVAPEENWSVQEHGAAPAPRVEAIEPIDAVDRAKRAGNAAFNAGEMEAAARAYTQAIAIAAKCAGAHGLDDDLIGKLRANRAEAFLQLERWEEAAADADVAIESDPCFVKAYVRKARASRGLEQWEEAASALRDALEVSPGNKSVLALLEEEHVRKLVREGGDATLSELAALAGRLRLLVRKRSSAKDVLAILKQCPSLLTALKLVHDPNDPSGRGYVSAPNHDAQVYLRLATDGFALLAPLVRPMPKQPDLLREVLETLAASCLECATNQVAMDKYIAQVVPLLRAKDQLPFDVLRAAVKLLGAMAHRASARRLMHDPGSAEGLMYVLSHPDGSQARPATHIITAIHEMNDLATLGNLLSVEGAADVFW